MNKRRSLICLVLALVCVVSLAACGKSGGKKIKTFGIETAYGTLEYPKEHKEDLRHVEVTEGDVTMEVFYMVMGEKEWELFRIYFNDPESGNLLGYLVISEKEIPVTVATCEYAEDTFPDEEGWAKYSSMMGGMNSIISSIMADKRFQEYIPSTSEQESREPETQPQQPEKKLVDVALKYWTVKLPEGITVQEKDNAEGYEAVFRGKIGSDELVLYTVRIGEEPLESVIGNYTLNEKNLPFSVEIGAEIQTAGYQDAELETLYEMMDSINMVIGAVTADANYTEAS